MWNLRIQTAACWRSALALALSLLVGCKDQPPKPAPQPPLSQPAPQNCPSPSDGATQHVPIRVIRVLYQPGGGAAGDSPGSPTNAGCRLTDQHINAYIQQAQQVFLTSLNVSLDVEWKSGDPRYGVAIHDLRWNPFSYPVEPRQRRTSMEFFCYEVFASPKDGTFDPNRLNIFFTGNIKGQEYPDGPLRSANGNTVDPYSAANDFNPFPHPDQETFPGEMFVMRPHIFVNDRGGDTNPPSVVLEDHVLEHELTHWFLRQAAGQQGRYNAQEHIQCPVSGPCTIPYIMKNKTPHPLKWNDEPGICESYEVWTRARTPDWNQP